MTTAQIALTAGGLIGLGLALLVWRLIPAHADLAAAVSNLTPERALTRAPRISPTTGPDTFKDRVGTWTMRHLPGPGGAPVKDLAVLQIPVHRWYADKLMMGLAGLVGPGILGATLPLLGFQPPIIFPLGASLALGLGLYFLPNLNVKQDAVAARKEFSRALIAYMDLVALECNGGSQPRQAMEMAATVSDTWVFVRIREELERSTLSGQTPWEAMQSLSEELELPGLADVGDIMRLAGQDASVYEPLRARSSSMRAAVTNADLARANEIGERLSVPVAVLSLLFTVILVMPAVLRVFV